MHKKITIIGAGLAGAYLGLLLGKQGYTVEIFESRSDIRKNLSDEGRSYNLTLYYRGIQALKKLGLWEKVKEAAVQIEGNMTHVPGKKLKLDVLEKNGDVVLYTIHRTALNSVLLNEVEKLPNVKVTFNTRLLSVQKRNKTICMQDSKTKKVFTKKIDCIVGADGINSVVRSELQRGTDSELNQENFGWGYKEAHITPERARLLNLPPQTTHHWPAQNALLIGFPNTDKSFTLMFNMPVSGPDSAETLINKTVVKKYLAKNFPDLLPDADAIAEDLVQKPLGKFVTVYSKPWYFKDFMIILGDAAHGVIPFYGQGMCSAFEDCLILNQCLQKNKDWEKAFARFQAMRKRNTDVLAFLSQQNFRELRDLSKTNYYLLRDKADTLLNRLLPNFWSPPLYKRIAHADEGYADAYARVIRQRMIAKYSGMDAGLHMLAVVLSAAIKLNNVLFLDKFELKQFTLAK